jgi:hypothetical protein
MTDHTVTLDVSKGWAGWKMTCQRDRFDQSRRCWPHHEDHAPYTEEEMSRYSPCTLVEWFEESGGVDMIDHLAPVTFDVEVTKWDADGPLISLDADSVAALREAHDG